MCSCYVAFNFNFFSKKDKSAPVDALLYKYFGQQKLSESRRKLIVPAYEIVARHPYIFRSCQAKQDRNRDFLLDQVARSTSTSTALPKAFALAKQMQEWGPPQVFMGALCTISLLRSNL